MKAKTTSLPYYLATLTIAVLLTLLSSCVKEEEGRRMEMATYDFTATIEPFASEGGQKVRLVNEEWIYWELDDMISIGSDQTTSGDEDCEGWLKIPDNGSDFVGFNGAFMTTLPAGSKYFLGLHPRSMNNRIRATGGSSFSATISLPDTQGFRNDISFAKQVFPMVAWYGGSWDEDHPKPFNLDFHSLAGIVRFQIFNTGAAKTISKVVISSIGDAPRQLKGAFTVEQYNTNTPYLTPAANTAANRTLVLDCGTDGRELGSEILSFYVVLPALGGNGTTTLYPLQFEVHATDGSVCTKRMSAGIPVRRNGITYRNAIDVSDWSDASATAANPPNGAAGTNANTYTWYTFNKESVRIPWRIAWDYFWYQDTRAAAILKQLNDFIKDKAKNDPNDMALAVNYSWDLSLGKDYTKNTVVSSQWYAAWCATGIAGNTAWFNTCTTGLNTRVPSNNGGSYFADILLTMYSGLLNGLFLRPAAMP